MRLIYWDDMNKALAEDMADSALRGVSQLYREGLLSAKYYLDMCKTVDAVPVVRCKDCKYWDETGACNNLGGLWEEFEFCSDGERKNETDRR